MKVLLISTGSGSRGGGEMYLLYLAEELARQGHDIHLLFPDHPRMDEIISLFPSGITIHRARLRNTYDRKLRQVGAVLDYFNRLAYRQAILSISPDIIHINQQVAEDGLDLLLAVRTLQLPYVTTIHITRSAKNLGARFGRLRDWLTRKVLLKSKIHVITVSKEMRRLLIERLGNMERLSSDIHVVYNGVRCESDTNYETRKRIRAEWGINDYTPIIGTVGRMEEQKNPFFFLGLVSELVSRGKVKKAIWIGDGRLRSDITNRSKESGLYGVLHIDGWRKDVMDRLHALDIFILPSRFEGLPLALQQAMCAGLPVCASDVDGMREAIEDGTNGYLCQPDDMEQWLDRISGLLGNYDLRKKMGSKGQALVKERFSMDSMVNETLKVYEKVISSGKS
jgi:glycosyltransferase involved in cell wall biosynthesis